MRLFIRQRDDENVDRTFSTMREFGGCETYQILEPGVGPKRMPAGTFRVMPLFSEDHGYVVPWYLSVPGHTADEFHIGNDERDTDGCSLIGDVRGVDDRGLAAVLHSSATFDRFMASLGLANYRELNAPRKAAAWLAAHPDIAAGFQVTVLDVRAAA
jgi:hypothetical protein